MEKTRITPKSQTTTMYLQADGFSAHTANTPTSDPRKSDFMKVTISLDKPKVSIVIEGTDTSMGEVSELVEQALVKIKKVWLDYIKRQTKLP